MIVKIIQKRVYCGITILAGACNLHGSATGFDANIGSVAIGHQSCFEVFGIGMKWFDQILNDETTAANASNNVFPSMKKLHRAVFSQSGPVDRGQRAGAIVGLDEFITVGRSRHIRLQAGRLFMLANI